MDRDDVYSAIDACRSPDDLSLPEMESVAEAIDSDEKLRVVFERSGRFDEKVVRAMGQVPVPDSLKQKLLNQARLQGQSILPEAGSSEAATPELASPELDADCNSDSERVDLPKPRRSPLGISRRAVLIAAPLIAVAAVVIVLVKVFSGTPTEIQPSVFANDVLTFLDQDESEWSETQVPLDAFPRPRSLSKRWTLERWKKLSSRFGSTVVYEIADHNSRRLLIVRRLSQGETIPAALSAQTLQRSGGLSGSFHRYGMGFTVKDRTLYILLVDPKENYPTFFDRNFG